MRTIAAKYLLPFASAILFTASAVCQNPVSYLNDAGSPAYAVNIPVPNGYINISNGNLHLEFSLASPPQRGALKANERLVYDSRIWMFSPYGSHYHWWPYNIYGTSTSSGGWQMVKGYEVGSTSSNEISYSSSGCSQPYYGAPWEPDGDQWYTYSFSWTDPSGATHPFSATETDEYTDCWTPASPSYTSGWSTDGSGYSMSFDAYGYPVITDSKSNQVYPDVADRYGNTLSSDSSGNLIDDKGQTPVIATTSGSTTYYDVLAPNGTSGTGGTRVRYTVTTAPVSVSTSFDFGTPAVYEWSSTSDLQPIQSIQLPDGSEYTFSYDGYGSLSSMTLPTGGTVTFGYSNVIDATNTMNRWITSYAEGSNPATTFTAAACGGGCSQYVYMNRPSGDQTRYFFTINNGAWNTSTDVNSGTSTWALITSTANTYSNPCTTYPCSGPNYLLNTLTSTSLFDPTGSTGIGSQTYTTFAGLLGPSSVQQWDYTTGTPSTTPTTETDYTYTSSGDPSTVIVKDSTGSPVSQTTYGYTTSAATVSPTPPDYWPSGATVSYLHTVQNWLNTSPSASPTTTITMDATGQVTSVQDPDGHTPATTTYQCEHSLPLVVTNSLGQQTTYGYDCGSGAITSVQDPNGNTTSYAYESTAGRLHTISYPDSGSTTYSYPYPYEVDTSIDASPDTAIASQSIVDSFGRPSKTIQNGISSTTTYDVNGRVDCVENPHTGSSTTDKTCVTSYDTLNRPLTKTLPDGSAQTWAYTVDTTALKAVTTATDEAGNQTTSYSNVFGQLTSVVEPGPSGNLTTGYTYDGLGNLININQIGLGSPEVPRVRTFDYDSLSRLRCASNPENTTADCPGSVGSSYAYTSGTVGYIYDANGNVTSMEDARGITVSNTYDALNRLTAKTATGINYQYTYDSLSGLPNNNSIGRLVAASNSVNANEVFSYDTMGRVNWQSNYTPSSPNNTGIVMTASYDKAGNMTDFHYPDGRHITQTFDASGRLNYVNYADQSGTTVNYPYVSSIAYSPLGGMSSIALGNGVAESISYNNRAQPCEIAATYPATPGSSTMTPASDKKYYFASSVGTPCGTTSTNNGNVHIIDDALNSTAKKQTFTFDSLNRLTGASRADSAFSYTYAIDSFGNMTQNTLTYSPTITFPSNQLQPALGYSYDAAGNLADTGSSSGGQHYTYDSLGQQTQVDYGTTATYTYDAVGSRIRKDTAGYGSTEYVSFGGQLMAEINPGVSWTDNIYANGQLVARDHSSDTYVDFTATNSASGESWAYNLPIISGIVIQSGAKLVWRQYQSGAASPQGGLDILTTIGTWSSWWLTDQDGHAINSDSTQNAWHNRVVDLTSLAGQTLQMATLDADSNTGAGSWEEKFADIALVQPDGTVVTLYNDQPSIYWGGGWGSSGVSGQTFGVNTAANPYIPAETAHYYLADHLGSARVEFAAPGWPVWSEDYAPYGQEVDAQPTSNIHKFTGYERDPETGNDYAQARYYSSQIQGRFMSPDPYMGSMNISNPQSLNRYSYALNNPVEFVDPSGLDCVYLNDAGTGIDEGGGGIDQYSNPDECGKNGGYWVDGGLTSFFIDANAGIVDLYGTNDGIDTFADYQDTTVFVDSWLNTDWNLAGHITIGLAGQQQVGQNPQSDTSFVLDMIFWDFSKSVVPGAVTAEYPPGKLRSFAAIPVTGMQAKMIQNLINQSIVSPPYYSLDPSLGLDCGTWAQSVLNAVGIQTGPMQPYPNPLMDQLGKNYTVLSGHM